MPSPSPITRSASHQQCITKYLFKTALVTGMSQLLVYLPAARTSQVTQVHAQQSPISLGTGRPGARGGERGQSRGPVSGRGLVGAPQSQHSQPVQPGLHCPPLRWKSWAGWWGRFSVWETEESSRFAGRGPGAQEKEGAGSGSTLAVQQLLRGSDRVLVSTAHAQPIGSRLLRVLEPKNRN